MVDIATKRKILIEYGAGASIVALSKKYAVSRKTISKILTPQKSSQKVPKKFPLVPSDTDKEQEAILCLKVSRLQAVPIIIHS